MPGKTITDYQVHKYKQHRNKLSQVASAAKAGLSHRRDGRQRPLVVIRMPTPPGRHHCKT